MVLSRGPCDYINANLVEVAKASRKYILTQGPLAETVGAFWLMVWEQKSKAVLMLNKIVEKKQVKCHWYWPQAIGEEHTLILEDVGLKVEYMDHRDRSHWAERTFKLTDTSNGESREVLQFHYTTWPDFGVPSSPNAFLEFLRAVRTSGSLEETAGPAIVHCSAGIGRSGTFCLVDSCLVLIDREGLNSVSVREVLLEMRKYRMGLIQTPDQLRFSYQAIIEGAKRATTDENGEQEITSSDEIESAASEEEDEPPPLPPPRTESLLRSQEENGPEKPLPTIPASESAGSLENDPNERRVDDNDPNKHRQKIVENENDPLKCKNDNVDDMKNDSSRAESPDSERNTPSPDAELRQRKREERREKVTAQIRDIKRKQHAAEQWTQLKRSVCAPLSIAGVIALAGGLLAYYYFRS